MRDTSRAAVHEAAHALYLSLRGFCPPTRVWARGAAGGTEFTWPITPDHLAADFPSDPRTATRVVVRVCGVALAGALACDEPLNAGDLAVLQPWAAVWAQLGQPQSFQALCTLAGIRVDRWLHLATTQEALQTTSRVLLSRALGEQSWHSWLHRLRDDYNIPNLFEPFHHCALDEKGDPRWTPPASAPGRSSSR